MSLFDTRFDHEPEVAGPSLASVSRQVWRRKALVLTVVLVTLVVAVLLSLQAPKTYQASAEVRVSSGNLQSTVGPSSAETNTLLATQVQVLLSTQLANEVNERLGGEVDIIGVAVEGVPESQVAVVTVEAATAQGAADAANAFVFAYDERRDRGSVEEATSRAGIVEEQLDALNAQQAELQAELDAESTRVNQELARITIARDAAARQGAVLDAADVVPPNTTVLTALQTRYSENTSQLSVLRGELRGYQLAATSGDGGVAIISLASLPGAPVSLGLVPTAALAVLLGLALGIALALVLAATRKTVVDRAAAGKVVPGAALLGPVPALGKQDGFLDVDGLRLPALSGPSADSYRVLGSQLVALFRTRAVTRLLVAGARAGDGQPAAAGGMAVALAAFGKSVVLVDANLREHAPTARDSARHLGLTDVLVDDELPSGALLAVDVPGAGSLHVLPSGRGAPEPELLLTSAAMGNLVARLGADFDVVIIAGSPLVESGDSLVMLSTVESVLLEVLLGHTRESDVTNALERVAAADGRVLGVVLHDPYPRRSSTGTSTPVRRATVSGRPGAPAHD